MSIDIEKLKDHFNNLNSDEFYKKWNSINKDIPDFGPTLNEFWCNSSTLNNISNNLQNNLLFENYIYHKIIIDNISENYLQENPSYNSDSLF